MANYHEGCYLDQHPHAVEIADWLRQGLTSTAVNKNLAKLGDTTRHSAMTISNHRRKCLGMTKQWGGRPKQLAVDIPEETPSMEEFRDLAMRVLFHRLKTDPGSVPTSVLTPMVTAIIRGDQTKKKDEPKDHLDEVMGDITSQAA